MKKRNFKKPNPLIYPIGKLCAKIYTKFVLNLKVEKNETKNAKRPYVLLANHEASIDFMSLLAALKGKIIFVVSNAYYQTNPIKWLLDACRIIPKQQFYTSVANMKRMKSAVENGFPLAFYPAGLMTGNGISTPIPDATGKSLKWFGCDVYAAVSKGSYLSKPKWSKVGRKGKVTLNIIKLFTAEEVKNLDEKVIQARIKEVLDYDSYENQKQDLVPYKNGNNIEGLENVLYKCPKCGKEFVMETTSIDTLTCKFCNNQAKANTYGLLEKVNPTDVIYETPSDWSRYIKNDLSNNLNPMMESTCKIQMINYKERKFEFVGNGLVRIDEENITLEGLINNEMIKKEFSISKTPTLPYTPGKCFDLQEEKEIYRIHLENPKHTMKWIYYTEIMHKKTNKVTN